MVCNCSGGSSCQNTECDQCTSGCVPGVPTPYYNTSEAVQEYHGQPIVQQTLVAALSSGSDFVVPACGVEAVVTFRGLTVLQIGSYLWNSIYGYFRVTGFNSAGGETKLINDCLPPNAPAGTVVPRCTLFNIVAPPWNSCLQCEEDNGYIYVFPAGPPPMPAGNPFAFDIDSVVGNVVYLKWHSITVLP